MVLGDTSEGVRLGAVAVIVACRVCFPDTPVPAVSSVVLLLVAAAVAAYEGTAWPDGRIGGLMLGGAAGAASVSVGLWTRWETPNFMPHGHQSSLAPLPPELVREMHGGERVVAALSAAATTVLCGPGDALWDPRNPFAASTIVAPLLVPALAAASWGSALHPGSREQARAAAFAARNLDAAVASLAFLVAFDSASRRVPPPHTPTPLAPAGMLLDLATLVLAATAVVASDFVVAATASLVGTPWSPQLALPLQPARAPLCKDVRAEWM